MLATLQTLCVNYPVNLYNIPLSSSTNTTNFWFLYEETNRENLHNWFIVTAGKQPGWDWVQGSLIPKLVSSTTTLSCSIIAPFSWSLSRTQALLSETDTKEKKAMVRMTQLSNIWKAGEGLLDSFTYLRLSLPLNTFISPSPGIGLWPTLGPSPWGWVPCCTVARRNPVSHLAPGCCGSSVYLETLIELWAPYTQQF